MIGSPLRRLRRTLPYIARQTVIVFLATLAGLLLAELAIRITGVDWRYVDKNLYWQNGHLASHIPDPNPELLFRLRPSSHEKHEGEQVAAVNAFGERGPERSATKPAGVYRIFVFGGSNVYGMGLENDKTWPAQLEAELDRRYGGGYEVWNFGVSAYVGLQMAVLAQEKLDKYDPDLIVFAMSNRSTLPFLQGAPAAPIFLAKPEYWQRLLPPDTLDSPVGLPFNTRLWLMNHCAVYRFAVLTSTTWRKEKNLPMWGLYTSFEEDNVAAIRKFVSLNKERVKTCFFVGPYAQKKQTEKQAYEQYFSATGMPVFELRADDLPAEYREIHPLADVTAWYASNLADWLATNGLLKQETAGY